MCLERPVDWMEGSELVIAPTGSVKEEAEVVVLLNRTTDGLCLHLDRQLQHEHLGESREFGGRTVELRAEVGLLMR